MKIVALIDQEAFHPEDPQLSGATEAICREMEFHVVEALRLLGHEVEVLPFGPDVEQTIRRLRDISPGLVFNLTEHFRGDRRMDASIAGLLDLLGIPYTGTGPDGMILCRDKATCKRILGHHHIRVPAFATVPRGRRRCPRQVGFPMVVKPQYEDGSDGISLASLVHNEQQAYERIALIHNRLSQPAICEQFVSGREIYVGIIGNRRLYTFPPRELFFGRSGGEGPLIATARVKRDAAYRRKWQITYGNADLSHALMQQVQRISKRIYRILYLRDYGRIDLRIADTGEIVFLEANPNPDLSYGEDLAEAAQQAGIEHPELVRRIVNLALSRYAES
ncbi:MAG TPA: ATP-grasp domain-containing protein [Lentisphaerae bacterium]|nr:ATP-grasp domain-containing protein [Lentisphaerota bacterium]